MPRPKKGRKICTLPRCRRFKPACSSGSAHTLSMPVDEYEAIRLIDFEELTQEECALQMGVSRSTVQAIYASARKRLASFIVNGHNLVIGGGDYEMHPHSTRSCGRGCCRKPVKP